jgi:hypothetical protein
MTVERDNARLVFVKLADAVNPPNGIIQHYKNYWWVYDEEKDSIVFWKTGNHLSAQCNTDERITRSFITKMYPWATARLIPSIFRGVDLNHYC